VRTRTDIIAVICFFVSGFAGLVYEICWIRKASLVFGATTLAVSTVVAIFFTGLAVGSYLCSRYCQNINRPLRVYSLVQICIGVAALLSPAAFSLSENIYRLFYQYLVNRFFLLALSRALLVALLILPPTILMGTTLPLFCRRYVTNERKISLSVGLLYGLNTLGAAIGCAVCGFYLIPCIGVNRAIYMSAILNISIGLLVLVSQWRARRQEETMRQYQSFDIPQSRSAALTTTGKIAHYRVLTMAILFFLSGFAAMGNEILWVRFLSLLVYNTVYTYTLTLTITLIGIVLGSMLTCRFMDRTHRREFIFGAAHVLTALSVLAVITQPVERWKTVIDAQQFSVQIGVFLVVLLLPAILSGLCFPLAIRMVVAQPSLAAVGVGKMSAINTTGGIVGSLAVGFLLLPWFGLQKTFLLTTLIGLLIAFTTWIVLEGTLKASLRNGMIVLSSFAWLTVLLLAPVKLPADFLAGEDVLVDYREGLSCNLAVVEQTESHTVVLTIDRLWQGQDRKNHQIMAAHVPMMLHDRPEKICVIGIGVGQTASRFLLYDIKQLDCVDIESKLRPLVCEHFECAWMQDGRIRFIVEDGRNYLTNTQNKYDLISVEVGQVFRPNVACFYTVEFYRQAREKLNANGILCQFVPLRSFGSNEFCSVIRTFLEVFPESILWYNRNEFLLIGSVDRRLKVSHQRLEMLHEDKAIAKDLEFAYWGGPEEWLNKRDIFLSGFLCGPNDLKTVAGRYAVCYDDLPALEYVTAEVGRQNVSPEPVIELLKPSLQTADVILDREMDIAVISKIRLMRDKNLKNVLAEFFYSLYLDGYGFSFLQKAILQNADNVKINNSFGNAFALNAQYDQAIKYYTEALRIDWQYYKAHRNLAYVLGKQGIFDRAEKHYLEAVRINPRHARAHKELADIYFKQKKNDKAVEYYQKALEINPNWAQARYAAAMALIASNRFDEAVSQLKQAIKLAPEWDIPRQALVYITRRK